MSKPSRSELFAIAAESRTDPKTVAKYFDADRREAMKPMVRERIEEAVEKRRARSEGDRA